jgi:hypothetical protein
MRREDGATGIGQSHGMRTRDGAFHGDLPVRAMGSGGEMELFSWELANQSRGMRKGDGTFFMGTGQSEKWDEEGRWSIFHGNWPIRAVG